jgi:hypothetical protein
MLFGSIIHLNIYKNIINTLLFVSELYCFKNKFSLQWFTGTSLQIPWKLNC